MCNSKSVIPAAVSAVIVLLSLPSIAMASGASGLYYGDLGQAIASVLIFAILFLILRKYAWGPVVGAIRHREQDMADALKTAETQQSEAAELLEEYRARLDRAEADAANVIAKSRREAADAREDILTTARVEARKHIAKGAEDIERARREALHELRIDTAKLAMDVAEQVIGRQLTDDDHTRMMERSMLEIEQQVRLHEGENEAT